MTEISEQSKQKKYQTTTCLSGVSCQAFSMAGKRRGFEDTRGTLFFEIARIAKQKQPRLLLLENVKGLLSHDSGNTFKTILRSLDELGYDCQWQVLNSKDFGVPQKQERGSLSDILERQVDQNYFLSEIQMKTVLSRTKNYENKLATRSGQTIPMGNLMKPIYLKKNSKKLQKDNNKE